MKQYISKSALVAEIERLRMNYGRVFNEYDAGFSEGRSSAFDEVLSFLNTLEVKEEPKFTADDIMKLDALLIRMWQSKSPNKYEEVLKQFKAQKGE